MSKTKFFFLIFALLLIFLAASAFTLQILADAPGSQQAKWIGREFTIQDGETWYSLGTRLKSERLIRSLTWYKIQLYLRRNPKTLKAGAYTWPRFMKITEIIPYFQVARAQITYPVTIPEGFTRREVALLLEKKSILSAKDFLSETSKITKYRSKFSLPIPSVAEPSEYSLEGFLFPDTYFLPKDYRAEQMVSLMLQNFLQHFEDIVPDWKSYSPEAVYEKIILASIVQKEYRAESEAPIIASVFQNRLDRNIKLESCATVVYVLTEERNRPHPNRILFKDLEEPSRYNTYLNQGLPPHPIANVSAIAMKAAFHQAKTDYLFFVVKDSSKGTHTFSASFADHNAARETYLDNYFR